MKKILLGLLCFGLLTGCAGESKTGGIEAKDGDVVNIDYIGKLDGTAFQGGTADGAWLELGSGTFIDGFEEQVVGMKTGKSQTIKVTFPSNYGSSDLAGKECTFDITLNQVYREVKDEACQSKDVVKIDFVGKYKGQAFQGGTASAYLLQLGSNQFVDGFEEQLINMKTSQQKSIEVTFPSNYGSTTIDGKEVSLANATVTFDVAVNHIYREVK